jgi:menaquinol-cytochrome c reductase iron-sulfur subunit
MRQTQFPENRASAENAGRRGFLKSVSALFLGAVAMVAPLISGAMVILDPLRRKSQQNAFLLVTSLNSVPEDGMPRKFVVVSNRIDAWNRNPAVPVGAVYLRRTGSKSVQALNVVCPHAGCFVDYVTSRQGYVCPCHNSTFTPDGKLADPKSPSPRGLDELQVEIRNDSEVWVRFENFLAGHDKKIPVA